MNKKTMTHVLIITAIVIAAFVAAALTPVKKSTNTNGACAVTNIAKVDFESRTFAQDGKMIADNKIPLASASETVSNIPVWYLIIAASALMMMVVIYEDCKDKKAQR